MPAAPEWRQPMLAQLLRWPDERRIVESGDWVFERKLDGLRGIAVRNGPQVTLWSRNHLPFNHRFPALIEALAALPVQSFVLDGEIVAGEGFLALQSGGRENVARFVAFDLPFLLGEDLTGLPLEERSGLLRRTVATGDGRVAFSAALDGTVGELMETACSSGWEGLVAKRRGSRYQAGRSPDWRKLKCTARQELVIVGWTDPSGARTGFGALLVGYYEGDRLVYAGKVGTGFDERTLRSLHAQLVSDAVGAPAVVDAPRMRGAHWVSPRLVAEVGFTEWTADGKLRHPRFLGIRPDKDPRSVLREDRPVPGSGGVGR